MREPSFQDDTHRFAERPDVKHRLATLSELSASINEDVSYLSPEYESSVVFSYIPGERVAIPLVASDAHQSHWYRSEFRRHNVDNRRVVVPGTALNEALQSEYGEGFAVSGMNKEESPQMVYTTRLEHEGVLVGAYQSAFSPALDKHYFEQLPDQDEIEEQMARHTATLGTMALHMAQLQESAASYGPLGLALEKDSPVAPNAYVLRWDVVGSTRLMRSANQAVYEAFQNQVHLYIRRFAETYAKRTSLFGSKPIDIYVHQGDGAYIVLELPKIINPYDKQALDSFKHYTVEPFEDNLRKGLSRIIGEYSEDINPAVLVSGMYGYAEEDGLNNLNSRAMTELAATQKNTPLS